MIGPEIFLRYRTSVAGVQEQVLVRSPKYPHGHGFIAAMSEKREGNVSEAFARATVTCRSSSG
ncbi:MAG TPA: hypothetical protein VLB83_05190, partial [Candidatus Paceibacterota bacterium]|nr:hypothetical protein [Candidatus Paceibacterota bacterium]